MFKVDIIRTFGEFTKKEEALLKYENSAIKIDAETSCEQGLVVCYDKAAVLEVHNDALKEGNQDYNTLVIIDKEGNMYTTSSSVVLNNIASVIYDVEDLRAGGEDCDIYFYKRPSKNNAQDMILCRII